MTPGSQTPNRSAHAAIAGLEYQFARRVVTLLNAVSPETTPRHDSCVEDALLRVRR